MRTALTALLRANGQAALVLCLAAACALITVATSILTSGVVREERPVRLAAADIVVGGADAVVVHGTEETEKVSLAGPARLSAATVQSVRSWAAEHDAEAVEDYISSAWSAKDGGHRVSMHAWSAARLGEGDLQPGSTEPLADQVVLESGWAEQLGVGVGDEVTLRTAVGVDTFAVSGILDGRDIESEAPAAYVVDEVAADLAGTNTPALVGIVGVAHVDVGDAAEDLQSRLDDAPVQVVTGSDRARVENPTADAARGDLVTLGGSLVALVVLVTVIVLGSAMAATLDSRRRTLVLLRTLAVTPRQLIRAAVCEAIILAAVAVALGAPAGLLATKLMSGLLRLAGVLNGGVELRETPTTALIAIVATVALAAVLSWATIRRLAATPPATVVRSASESTYRPRPLVLATGWILIMLGIGLSMLPAFLGGVAAIAIAGGGGLLLAFGASLAWRPLIALLIRGIAALRRHASHRNGTAWLSGVLLQSTAVRFAAASVPLVLGMSLALVQVAVPATLAISADRSAAAALQVDSAVTSEAGIRPGEFAGVAIASQQVSAWVDFLGAPEDFEFTALGTNEALNTVLHLPVVKGTWDGSAPSPGSAVVSEFTADSLGLNIGDPINLVLADGSQTHPRVVAIHGGGYGAADIVLPFEQLATHRVPGSIGAHAADAILGAPEPAEDDLATAVPARELLGGGGPNQATAVSSIPLLVLFAYISISVASTLARTMAARRREHQLLRRLGVGRDQLKRAIWFEAVAGAVVCVGLGAVIALLPLTMIAWGVTGSLVPGVPLWFALLDGLGLAGLVIAATVISGRRSLRQ